MILAASLVLAACASPPAPQTAAPQAAVPPSQAMIEPPPEPVTAPVPPPAPAPSLLLTPNDGDVAAQLEQGERLRSLNPAELQAHIAALGDPGNDPARQMQLALALAHTHQPPDTARALGLLQRVIQHPAPESAELKPLARVLASRLMDQRRLEDTVERQAQQLRESARRIEQLNERLEAMRAIERSLMPRPPAPGGNGNRSGAP